MAGQIPHEESHEVTICLWLNYEKFPLTALSLIPMFHGSNRSEWLLKDFRDLVGNLLNGLGFLLEFGIAKQQTLQFMMVIDHDVFLLLSRYSTCYFFGSISH